jgi:hypothetical protein
VTVVCPAYRDWQRPQRTAANVDTPVPLVFGRVASMIIKKKISQRILYPKYISSRADKSDKMPTEQRLRQIATDYVENTLYRDDVEAEAVSMTTTDAGTRVGLEVRPESSGFLGAVASALAGGSYATVTIDDTGDVVLSNKDLSEGDFYEKLDRQVSAEGARTRERTRNRRQAERQEELVENFIENNFGFDFGSDSSDEFSPPERCPRCKESGSFLSPQFEELGDGTYQCTNDDCAHIVDLSSN